MPGGEARRPPAGLCAPRWLPPVTPVLSGPAAGPFVTGSGRPASLESYAELGAATRAEDRPA